MKLVIYFFALVALLGCTTDGSNRISEPINFNAFRESATGQPTLADMVRKFGAPTSKEVTSHYESYIYDAQSGGQLKMQFELPTHKLLGFLFLPGGAGRDMTATDVKAAYRDSNFISAKVEAPPGSDYISSEQTFTDKKLGLSFITRGPNETVDVIAWSPSPDIREPSSK